VDDAEAAGEDSKAQPEEIAPQIGLILLRLPGAEC